MKVRFYCDLFGKLPLRGLDIPLFAFTDATSTGTAAAGCTRVAFDVEFPDSVLREADVIVPGVANVLDNPR